LLKRTIPDPDPEAIRSSLAPEPFRIEPIFSPRIWGSRSLAPLFPEKTNLPEPIGEAWLTGVDCRVATGPFAGKTLGEAWRELPVEWRGERFREPGDFPLLLKFIFPQEKLSIQVHPDDAYAALHEKAAGGRGKTEMWHIVSAEPGATVLIGLKPGVDKQKFLTALDAHTLENLFVAHPVREGDTFFVPAGTPHTIGAGMVVCEVQEYSDLTYRVYDYGRVDAQGSPRELHIGKALDVMNFGLSEGIRIETRNNALAKSGFSKLVDCPYFGVFRVDFDRHVHFNPVPPKPGEGRFRLEVILAGEGVLTGLPRRGATGEFPFKQGECWFVPANTFTMSCSYHSKGKASFLTAWVP
jgi:mannose-6-phosphate isomerase